MGHVKIRNRKTGGVWECPEDALEAVLDSDNPHFGTGWVRAAESAETTEEKTAVAASRDTKEK